MSLNLFQTPAPFQNLLEEYNEILERMAVVSREYKNSVSNIADLLSSQFPKYGYVTAALGRKVYSVITEQMKKSNTEPIDWNVVMPRIIDEIDKEYDI